MCCKHLVANWNQDISCDVHIIQLLAWEKHSASVFLNCIPNSTTQLTRKQWGWHGTCEQRAWHEHDMSRAWRHHSLFTLITVTYMHNYCTYISHFTFGFLYFQLHGHELSHAWRHRSLVALTLIIVHIHHILLLVSYVFKWREHDISMLDVTILLLQL